MPDNFGCPFCDSDLVPSSGLPGVYQHASNVHECIIGDLGVPTDRLPAWNRRSSRGMSVEVVGRAIAAADGEDYMEDCERYDKRARFAIKTCGLAVKP